jgi:N-acyl-D-aspartate/D-glutamate deacylase
MFDLILKNGLVFDGLGSPPAKRDLGVRQGKIAAVAPCGSFAQSESAVVRNAEGLWVTPGFIDIHTHYDLELEVAPGLIESVRHGVTTVVIGNCSLSLAIGEPQTLADIFERVETLPRSLIQKWMKTSISWRTPGEYLDHLRETSLGPNVAALFGHSSLRAHVMGLERSLSAYATNDELDRMRGIAGEALDAGFIGVSIDMVPWHMMSGDLKGRTIPSQHADLREYRMLAEICRERDAVFQATPNPQRALSLVDLLRISHGIGRRPLRATILAALDSVSDRRLWRVFSPMLGALNGQIGYNLRFQTLTEPFTVFSDGPVTPLFEEFAAGVRLNDCDSREARARLWRAPDFREQFRREWVYGRRRTFHRRLDLMEITRCPEPGLAGMTFTEASQRAGKDPVDFFLDALERYDTDLRWVSTGANDRPEQRQALMSNKHILPGFSDAGAHVQHLGYYDCALSLLKQAATTGFLPIEKALARVTGEPARWFRLDAGTVAVGAKADFLLLNPIALRAPISEQFEYHDPILDGSIRMVKRGSSQIIEGLYLNGVLAYSGDEARPPLGRDRLGCVLSLSGSPDAENAERRRKRNRISSYIDDHPFTDYWDIFVLKHQHPINIALHAVGVVLFYGLLLAAWRMRNPWFLLLLPSSQLVGLAGHYFFERSHIDLQDAVFSVRASRCLNRMFFKILTGGYGREIQSRNRRLREYRLSQLSPEESREERSLAHR